MKPSKPVFRHVVDLGLRDVGVRNDPRRFAAYLGGLSVRFVVLVVLATVALCVLVGLTGVHGLVIGAFALVLTGVGLALALRTARRSTLVVMKVNAGGTNQATWLLIAPYLFTSVAAVVAGGLLVIPVAVLTLVMALLLWRGRGHIPALLRKVRDHLADDESVLGDGVGLVRRSQGRHDAFRLVVATDRRVLVVASSRSKRRFPLVDAPYERVSGFGIEWRYGGRTGVLSLTLAGADGGPSETHVISSMVPANLVSIAQALQSHGVDADDPAAVSEAARGWEEAKRRDELEEPMLDRRAMSTREFDHGLWLLLGVSAVAFYLNPFGVGFGVSRDAAVPLLVVVPVLCGVCGYLSGTKSSLAYIAPLNLLVAPAFFFGDASAVLVLMLVMSTVAAVGLWVGSALRGVTGDRVSPPAQGSLRQAVSARRLIRISGVLVAAMVALAAGASAAGFELNSVRMAFDEATGHRTPVDGRSNLTGNAASLTYTPGPNLREFITDEHWDAGPDDGARWELRSSFTKGYNVVSLAHYIFEPRLDDPAAVAAFVADKDREHSRLAGYRVTHTERVISGRKAYVWKHDSRRGFWYYAAWFPQPVHTVRIECVARRQKPRFKRLCAEAVGSLEFH